MAELEATVRGGASEYKDIYVERESEERPAAHGAIAPVLVPKPGAGFHSRSHPFALTPPVC